MIRVNCEQGSPEWKAARLGIPTASRFGDILTAKTRKLSASADKYALELCAEWLLGEPLDATSSQFMQRGSALESEAREWYAFENSVEIEQVGFVLRNNRHVGCSPDGLIGNDGVLEIKCLSPREHVAALLSRADEYTMQVQGQLWLCERNYAIRLYYNPAMPQVVQRVERDDDLIADLAGAVDGFCNRLHAMQTELRGLGCTPRKPGAQIPQSEFDEFDALVRETVPKV